MSHNTTFYMQKIQEPSSSYTIQGLLLDGTNHLLLYGGVATLDSSGTFSLSNKLSVTGNSTFTGAVAANGGIKLNGVGIPPSNYSLLVHGLTDSVTYAIPASSVLQGGAYIPTITAGSDCTIGTIDTATYTVVAKIVTVFGHAQITSTAAGLGNFLVSLPVASHVGGNSLHGNLNLTDPTFTHATYPTGIHGSSAQAWADLSLTAGGVTWDAYYTFSYIIE